MACRTGCPTQDHASWGDCLRASNIQMNAGDARGTRSMSNRAFNAEMSAYESAVKEGLDPRTTNMIDINAAKHAADKAGKPVSL